jgi:hypothetical protein
MRYCLILIILCFCSTLRAQQDVSANHKLGIKTSVNISAIVGDELQNPRPKFGYTAGAYHIYKPQESWSLYSEITASFRGSKFSNGDTGYSRISLFYLDLAVMPRYTIKKSKHSISAGPYASYLALSSLYLGVTQKPETSELNFRPYEIGLALFYHLKGTAVSFQVGPKLSLTNSNNGVNFIGAFPATGTGGAIRSVSIEIGLLF